MWFESGSKILKLGAALHTFFPPNVRRMQLLQDWTFNNPEIMESGITNLSIQQPLMESGY